MEKKSYNVLIAATGSVATIKLPVLVDSIKSLNTTHLGYYLEPRVIVTEHAKHFIKNLEDLPIYEDSIEWSTWKERGDPVVHIDLGKWANIMVIAPLDANTLAKVSQGICDNLLTSTIRAWDVTKPLIFCPAMNTRMWTHPITSKQIATLEEWGYEQIAPVSKTLMCGDTGVGAMAEVQTIIYKIRNIAEEYYRKSS